MSESDIVWKNYFYKNETCKEDVLKRIKFNPIAAKYCLPSTPILANYNTPGGSIYACAILEPQDTVKSLQEIMSLAMLLSANGAGVSMWFGNIRAMGSKCDDPRKEIDGIFYFIKMFEALIAAYSQGGIRKGAGVSNLPIHHPEIEKFVALRRKTGDKDLRCSEMNIGVVIDDEFMTAVENGTMYRLHNPKPYTDKYGEQDGEKWVDARKLFRLICACRSETGFPFIMFDGNVKRSSTYKYVNDIKCPNLCTEVLLGTNAEHPVALCCLGTVNLYSIYLACFDAAKVFKPLGFKEMVKYFILYMNKYLTELRNENPEEEYLAGHKTICKSIGIGFSGILDVYNTSPTDYIQMVKVLTEVITELREDGSIDKTQCSFAIAPNSYVSQLLGNVSPGIMPFPKENYSLKMHKVKREGVESMWSKNVNFSTLTHDPIYQTNFDKEVMAKIYADFTPIIDQGISFSVCEPLFHPNYWLANKAPDDERVDLSTQREQNAKGIEDYIIKLYKQGAKTIYYHEGKDLKDVGINVKSKPQVCGLEKGCESCTN